MAEQTPSSVEFQKAVAAAWQDANIAKKYATAENATRPFCSTIVEKSGLAGVDSEAHVLDLATGTGAAIKELYDAVPREKWDNLKVLGADVSPAMLDYLRNRGAEAGWMGLETQVIDGNTIDLPKSTYTHIFLSFAVFAMPDVLPRLFDLLKPGGFIGVTTWAYLAWHPLLARSISRMSSEVYSPSFSDLEDKMFAGRRWGDTAYLTSRLVEAGFTKVDTVREKHVAGCGTPKEFVETMSFPLRFVAMFWDEEKRNEWSAELSKLMLEEAIKTAGGEEEQVRLEFDGIIGWGWKNE
ncbi:S-adenosyl-L-methionine-dependent methyltransferase [Pyrenochaeta sp. MPI-SDFR-AT-0127]|nr:S-adenosyl-L-methionine-dependent methyltransferase [Pyrenochaeta sp. MPI-SDFR-AT-0127]